jgi:hypothetical protein
MRDHFDHLAKELGQAALGPSGITVVNEPITAETQYADLRYEPDPARQAARDRSAGPDRERRMPARGL